MATTVLRSDDLLADLSIKSSIEHIVSNPATSGLFFDLDGVLSNIHADPEEVQPLPGIPDILRSLAGEVGNVAVLSSRPASFLWQRFGSIEGLQILGLYGLERAEPDGHIVTAEDALKWLEIMPEILESAKRCFPDGVYVEDKRLSVGLHYRADTSKRDDVEAWAAEARSTWGVKLQPGRLAVELKPNLKTDKGSTLASVSSDLTSAWYCGDDLGDLPAFEYITQRCVNDSAFCGLAIGVGNDTVVDEVFESATVFLEAPKVLAQLLGNLVSSLGAVRKGPQ